MGQYSTWWPPTHGLLRLCVASGSRHWHFPCVLVLQSRYSPKDPAQDSLALQSKRFYIPPHARGCVFPRDFRRSDRLDHSSTGKHCGRQPTSEPSASSSPSSSFACKTRIFTMKNAGTNNRSNQVHAYLDRFDHLLRHYEWHILSVFACTIRRGMVALCAR